jgi:hypothetical protein
LIREVPAARENCEPDPDASADTAAKPGFLPESELKWPQATVEH